MSAVPSHPLPQRGGAQADLRFLESVTRQNMSRLGWFLMIMFAINAGMIMLGNEMLFGTRRFLPRAGQWPDVLLGPALLLVLAALASAPVRTRANFVVIAVAAESMASAWYFSLALAQFGPTAVYALTIIAMGVLILVPPRLFLGIILVSLALHLGLVFFSAVTLPVMVLTFTHGVVAAFISCVAQTLLYSAKEREYGRNVALIREIDALRDANREMELRCTQWHDSSVITAHDLKSPLESLVAALRLASKRREWSAEPHASLLRESIDTCVGLLDLGGRLLANARVSPAPEPQPVACDLRELVSSFGTQMAVRAADGGITLDVEIPEHPCQMAIDPVLLRSAVENVVDNAIAYSPSGSCVRIVLRRTDALMEIDVIDSGPGIPDEERKRLFHRFFQASNRPKGAATGSGLGLYIAERRIASMGGTLELHHTGPGGSTFRIQLPLGEGGDVSAFQRIPSDADSL